MRNIKIIILSTIIIVFMLDASPKFEKRDRVWWDDCEAEIKRVYADYKPPLYDIKICHSKKNDKKIPSWSSYLVREDRLNQNRKRSFESNGSEGSGQEGKKRRKELIFIDGIPGSNIPPSSEDNTNATNTFKFLSSIKEESISEEFEEEPDFDSAFGSNVPLFSSANSTNERSNASATPDTRRVVTLIIRLNEGMLSR